MAGNVNIRLTSRARAAWIAALLVYAPTTFASEAPSRYAIQAELRPLAHSTDGRFAIAAEARFTPEAKSADGRFALKAVNAPEGGCEVAQDAIFANGFEGS